VWSYDFVEERTHDGRKFRMLNIIDEFTHECLAIRVSRRLRSIDVIDGISDLFILRGVPSHIRSENARSSSPKRYRIGSGPSAQRPPTSTRAVRGRRGFIESFMYGPRVIAG
jgi:putative transposase